MRFLLADEKAFFNCLKQVVPDFRTHGLPGDQRKAVISPPDEPVYIVAGPGTGKTTVLVLRFLFLVFVHGYRPAEIIATTFTRKAAAQLRSRILGWGYAMRQVILRRPPSKTAEDWLLKKCEFSDALIDTFDSIAETVVTEHGPREDVVPITIEQLTANAIMLTDAVLGVGLQNSRSLTQHLQNIKLWPVNAVSIAAYLRQLSDRIAHDRVDIDQLARSGKAMERACTAIRSYRQSLSQRNMIDFSGLGSRFLELLEAGALDGFIGGHRVLFVDEFQDTNCLQEAAYLAMYHRFQPDREHARSLTVVGDDDQSIFRFRGATVEIFTNFPGRLRRELKLSRAPQPIFLTDNFRSRPAIVEFVNQFVDDAQFTSARVPCKPRLVARTAGGAARLAGLPILGMFSDSKEDLADRIKAFLLAVFRGKGFRVRCSGDLEFLIRGTEDHNLADAVLLAGSVRERTETRKDPRNLTAFLREKLEPDIPLFNPRGRALCDVPEVQELLGLLLACIDPEAVVQRSIGWLQGQFGPALDGWRRAALDFVKRDPSPGGLPGFVRDWAARQWRGRGRRGLADWPALELLFTLTAWLPQFCEHPEYQVYLEAVARAFEQAAPLSAFGGRIMFQEPLAAPSVKHLLQNVFAPIAAGSIDVDEDLMPHVPRHWLPAMTIHQAKGLEFPVVIVDIGSGDGREIRDFRRFPVRPASSHHDEDLVAPFSALKKLRQQRDGTLRAKDDVKRQYYVAYSRAQSVVLLVGHTSVIRSSHPLPSIPVGTRYDGTAMWQFVPASKWTAPGTNVVALI